MRTISCVLTAVALFEASCAAPHQQEQAQTPPPAPGHPTLEGNVKAVSQSDIRRGLAIVRKQMVKSFGTTLPVYSIYVVDENHMSIRYWAKGSQTWSYVERIRGQWQFTETAVERVITTGSNIPTS